MRFEPGHVYFEDTRSGRVFRDDEYVPPGAYSQHDHRTDEQRAEEATERLRKERERRPWGQEDYGPSTDYQAYIRKLAEEEYARQTPFTWSAGDFFTVNVDGEGMCYVPDEPWDGDPVGPKNARQWYDRETTAVELPDVEPVALLTT